MQRQLTLLILGGSGIDIEAINVEVIDVEAIDTVNPGVGRSTIDIEVIDDQHRGD